MLFYAGAYKAIVDPNSSTGSFERAVRQLNLLETERRRDVLVLGDSRIYAGLDPEVADLAGRGLRFINGGIPGTDPRSWSFLVREIDPSANRFHAIVIPVDSYTDDTSAIGSLDADDHAQDLHVIVFATKLTDVPKLAGSFDEPDLQRDVAFNMILRGPILRDDFQALLSNRKARWLAREYLDPNQFNPLRAHPFATDLSQLRADFKTNRITAPSWVSSSERVEIEKQVLRRPEPSLSYAAYRKTWLGSIVQRYAATGTPIIFVRIPARPIHRTYPLPLSGSLTAIADHAPGLAHFVPQAPYVAMERPELFSDHDHLDRRGSRLFSGRLGRDVVHALVSRSPPREGGALPQLAAKTPPPLFRLHSVLAALSYGIPIPFQSADFLIFFVVVVVVFYAMPFRLRGIALLVASYYIYLRWNGWYVVFLVFLTATDYVIALQLSERRGRAKRLFLVLGVALNLAFLGSFKYLNFITGSVASLQGRSIDPWLLAIVVPIGISFHTFQSISYLVDVANGRTKATRKPLDYALYIAFFPQILAGPIVRSGEFLSEWTNWTAPSAEAVSLGLREIVVGLAKKLIVADQFAPTADAYFANPALQPSATAAWCGAFAFAMQIYFDFSGYSDIAIGAARLLGFAFPQNFCRPYLATSARDFWRRWHITLSTWLRDYLYIPLGGSRLGPLHTYRNLFVTMLLGGLWHGANWTFVAWGAYHGMLLALERVFKSPETVAVRSFVYAIRVVGTFALVLIGWVLFRAQTFSDAATVYHAMLFGGAGAVTLPTWPLVALVAFAIAECSREYFPRCSIRLAPAANAVMLATLLLAIEMTSWPGVSAPFVYFKF